MPGHYSLFGNRKEKDRQRTTLWHWRQQERYMCLWQFMPDSSAGSYLTIRQSVIC